jgi:hypothetical protein
MSKQSCAATQIWLWTKKGTAMSRIFCQRFVQYSTMTYNIQLSVSLSTKYFSHFYNITIPLTNVTLPCYILLNHLTYIIVTYLILLQYITLQHEQYHPTL